MTSCDVGFVEWNGFCYYVNPTLQLAWSDARDWCALHVSSTIGSLAVSAHSEGRERNMYHTRKWFQQGSFQKAELRLQITLTLTSVLKGLEFSTS